MQKKNPVKTQNFTLDAKDASLGRLASQAAKILMGKNSPTYTPNIDCGYFVNIINAGQVKITGKKIEQKKYHRYTGYPGGISTVELKKLAVVDITKPIKLAISKMMPKNRLHAKRMRRLTIKY
ncbi:MAG: 50S ribosomal protein L13 [Candidatus Magasanikbacteria bacterium CG10_big_fil_rev_8_21_14_0_10_40_10]|uniref:Large ribosomal subunit protein uL13 n=1 Tax=Candidatus Magasanikbacteria bacterium CG10_big_fil_rev_8_21_14_0_10_40_10 TaxID=1974648 RepID=A0A2M6W4W3_9BACT|nr:MAG: 50S ribosomal protein L13 [Candidatus Magasanikbacteria bacterium CG10_big_fil_rev_8_21_14_0_10_40_10]